MASVTLLRISDYRILTAHDPEDLGSSVRQAMGDGWQPIGGVSVSLSESDEYRYVVYAQALIRINTEG